MRNAERPSIELHDTRYTRNTPLCEEEGRGGRRGRRKGKEGKGGRGGGGREEREGRKEDEGRR